MKKTMALLFGIIAVIAGIYVGCGGASAPPIDLPAPITGRIDVSSPDGEGNVTVTGTEGAVTGGYIVMVERVEGSAQAFFMLPEFIISSAHAADMPAVCDEEGHACAYSEEDGSFVIVIEAEAEDSLTIGLIHADSGAWRSPTITVTVPKPDEPEANCAGLGLTAAVVDVTVAPTTGRPVLLKQGSDSATNSLVIGDEGEITVEISGCYAHSVAANKLSTGDLIVVTSKEDKTIWAGILSEGQMKGTRSFQMQGEPMHAAFVGPIAAPLVAMKEATTVSLNQVALTDGSILKEMPILWGPTPVTGLTRSLGIDVIKMAGDLDQYLGMILTDKGDNLQAFITIFRADDVAHKITARRADVSGAQDLLRSVVSGGLYVDTQEYLRPALTDSESSANAIVQLRIIVTVGSTTGELGYGFDLDAVESWDNIRIAQPEINAVTQHDIATTGRLKAMKTTANDSGIYSAVVATDTGFLLRQDLTTATAPGSSLTSWAAGHEIVAIDLDDGLGKLFGADATDGVAIDGSEIIY